MDGCQTVGFGHVLDRTLTITDLMENILRLGINHQHLNWGGLMSQDRCLASLEESGDGATWVWACIPMWQGHAGWQGEGVPPYNWDGSLPTAHLSPSSERYFRLQIMRNGKKNRNCVLAKICGVYKSLQRTQNAFLPLSLFSLSLLPRDKNPWDTAGVQKSLPTGFPWAPSSISLASMELYFRRD